MIVVPGHTLKFEGAAYGDPNCPKTTCLAYGKARLRAGDQMDGGHALCSCGEQSGHLSSGRERRAWHRDHKIAVTQALA